MHRKRKRMERFNSGNAAATGEKAKQEVDPELAEKLAKRAAKFGIKT